jgi:hypothetical protein
LFSLSLYSGGELQMCLLRLFAASPGPEIADGTQKWKFILIGLEGRKCDNSQGKWAKRWEEGLNPGED